MKQSKRVKAFKNRLMNYEFNLSRVEALQTLIDICYSHLPGAMHGLDPSRIPVSSVPNKELEYRIRNEIDHHEANLRHTEDEIREVDEILNRMETTLKHAVIYVYAKGKTMESIAATMHLSTNALQYRINKELERVLDEKEEI